MGLFFFLFITLFIILLFIPFPVKIKIKYSKKNFIFKVYNLNISNKIKSIKDKYSLNYPEVKNRLPFFIKTIKNNLNFVNEIKFKSTLKIDIKIAYGLEDAAHTALVYGFISLINILTLNILSKIFIIKQNQIYVTPDFNNLHLKIQINSIIYISLAKIIYTGILLVKYRKKLKKLNPLHT